MSIIMRKRLLPVFLTLVFFMPVSVNAYDFGLLLNQSAGFSGDGTETDIESETTIIPRFSTLIGDQGDFFVSASVSAVHQNGQWDIIPELLRTEFSWGFGSTDLSIGRIVWACPLNLVAAGLFDGAHISHHSPMGNFVFGVWYTGLQYKGRANIAMTDEDITLLDTPLDWNDFANTYFASRRLVAALQWEHPSVAEHLHLSVALVGQVDVNNRDTSFHNQYLIASAALPVGRFVFGLGGALEMGQYVNGNETDFRFAFAADAGVHWVPPAPFHNMLSLTGRFTSGVADDGNVYAFTPITAMSHGNILQARISGLSVLALNYTARLHHTFSAGITASHFVRSDLGTFVEWPVYGETNGGYFLGTEFFVNAMWSPVSDVSLNLGGGMFLPSLGNAAPNADARWRIDLSFTLALF